MKNKKNSSKKTHNSQSSKEVKKSKSSNNSTRLKKVKKINDTASKTSTDANNVIEIISEIQEINLGDNILTDSSTVKSARFKQQEQQEENRYVKFYDDTTDYLGNIADSQKVIADEVENANDKIQDSEDTAEKKTTFIGKSIEGIKKKLKEPDDITASLLLMGGIVILSKIIEWFREALAYPGGIFKYFFDGLTDFMGRHFGGWGGFLASILKTSAKIILWIADKVLELIFGEEWTKVRDFWSEKITSMMDWWKEVTDYGIAGWIYKQLYDYIPEGVFKDMLLSSVGSPEAMKEKLRIQREAFEGGKLTYDQKKATKKQVEDMNKYRKETGKEPGREWVEQWNKDNPEEVDTLNRTTVTPNITNVQKIETKTEPSKRENINNSITMVTPNISNVQNVETKTEPSKKESNTVAEITKKENIDNTKITKINKSSKNKNFYISEDGYITSNIEGNVQNITKLNDEYSTISIKTISGDTIDISSVKNDNINVGDVIKIGQRITKNNDKIDIRSSNISSVQNTNKILEKVDTSTKNSSTTDVSNSTSNIKNVNIVSSTDSSKTIQKNINIKKIDVPQAQHKNNDEAFKMQNLINNDFAAQISRLSSESNTSTLLQTKASVN